MSWQRWLRVAVPVVLILAAIDLPFALDSGNLHLAVSVLILAIGALGLDVLTGRTGQISLGHAFFLGIGAYVAAKLGTDHNLNALIWIPAAGPVSGVIGGLVGPTALRLRGLYLAIVTIALVFIGTNVFTDVTAISGGPGGRAINAPHFWSLNFARGTTFAGKTISPDGCFYYLALFLLTVAMVFVRNLGGSRVGRSMAAVRDRELAAAVIGVDVARTKISAFVVSSTLAGICGALYGSYATFVDPTDWNLTLSISFVVMIVVGGLGSTYGPLLGALFTVALPSLLQHASGTLPLIQNSRGTGGGIPADDASTLVFGVLLIVFLIAEPRGVVGLGHRFSQLFRRQWRRPVAMSGQ